MELGERDPMATTWDHDLAALPDGTRVLHIGPPKTGTTTLQNALHAARAAMATQGVLYGGLVRHSHKAALAVTGRKGAIKRVVPPIRHWQDLVDEVHAAHESRVVLSSEFYADAGPDAIRRIITDLDPNRTHVVVTLRPLASILASQWQQYVQSGQRASYPDWLDGMFRKPGSNLSPTFWQRHRHDDLVARWAEVAGSANMTVVALDERDHNMVLRVFERLLALHDGTLALDPDRTNRSMTLPEIEVIRAFNIGFRARGLDLPLHSLVIRYGAAKYMKLRDPAADEPRIRTPAWGLEQAERVAREIVANIGSSGVRVIGDTDALLKVPTPAPDDDAPELMVTPEIAASTALGVLFASGLAGTPPWGKWRDSGEDLDADPVRANEPPAIRRMSTRSIAGFLVRRVFAAARARVNVRGILRR